MLCRHVSVFDKFIENMPEFFRCHRVCEPEMIWIYKGHVLCHMGQLSKNIITLAICYWILFFKDKRCG